MTNEMSRDQAQDLAAALADLVRTAHETIRSGSPSATAKHVQQHLGCELEDAVLVSSNWPASLVVPPHRGVQAHVEQASPESQWFGLNAMSRGYNELRALMLMERGSGRDRISAPEFTAAADGPASTSQVITFGLVCTRTQDGAPAVVCIRTEERHGPPTPVVEVLAANRDQAAALSDRLRTLIEDHDVLRGQVISFGVSENYGNELVTFLPRPEVSADDVILPTGLLPAIERHVLGVGDHADRLRHNGIHLKRGLLLHGPPGTGKTHTVRYLMGRATDSTVIVLSGASLHLIGTAAALARRLAPTVVVVEDVDLVGSDRSFSPTGNPVLFTLLDAMDGVASDADVTFILTTNRAEDLEEALIQRPGRVDLAVEIPRPDASGRRQLLGLYAGRAAVTADLEPAVRATEGATASALKELMRRAVLAALIADPHTDQPTIDDEILAGALEEFTSEAEALSRSLVGAGLQV